MFSACSKETPVQNYDFTKVVFQNNLLVDVPKIALYLDGVKKAEIEPGYQSIQLVARSNKKIAVSIRDAVNGTEYLDTSFTPSSLNYSFAALIDNTLGLRQFMQPPTTPIPDKHWRMQFVQNIQIGEEKKTIQYKFYYDETFDGAGIKEIPVTLDPVKYGELSKYVDIPDLKDNTGQRYPIYFRGFDAATGQLLVEFWPNVSTPLNQLVGSTGKRFIMPTPYVEYEGTLYWDLSKVYEL